MPASVGSSLRSWLKASSPPAEAPMPTIGNVSDGSEGDRSEGRSACGGLGVAASCTRPDERLGADFLCGAFRAISGSSSDPHEATRRTASHDRRKDRSEEHTSELQSPCNLVCRLLLEKKKHKDAKHDRRR